MAKAYVKRDLTVGKDYVDTEGGSGGGGTSYSTDEKIIGKWVDGSNVYQRTFIKNINGLNPFLITDEIKLGSEKIMAIDGSIEESGNMVALNGYVNASWSTGTILGSNGLNLYTGSSIHTGAKVECTVVYRKEA